MGMLMRLGRRSLMCETDNSLYLSPRKVERRHSCTVCGSVPLVRCRQVVCNVALMITSLGTDKDIAILITGALSRWVNHLSADLPPDKATQGLLRAVQANLKLAINYGLASNQTEMISSYLQVINMAQGDKWIRAQAQAVALALRAGKKSRPVKTAGDAVLAFATSELRTVNKTASVASVEDYIGNATADLGTTRLICAKWSR